MPVAMSSAATTSCPGPTIGKIIDILGTPESLSISVTLMEAMLTGNTIQSSMIMININATMEISTTTMAVMIIATSKCIPNQLEFGFVAVELSVLPEMIFARPVEMELSLALWQPATMGT